MKANTILFSIILFYISVISQTSCTDSLQKEIFSIELERYLKPIKVTIGTVSLNSIDVSWEASAPLFEIEYSINEDFSGNNTLDTIAENKYLITNLDENTRYFIRIRGISDKQTPKPSLYSNTVNTWTLLEVPIENINAIAEMEYTLNPYNVTTIVTVTWGKEGVEPEQISSITFVNHDNAPIIYQVTAEEANNQRKVINTGLTSDTEYMVRLYRYTKERGSCAVTTKKGPIPTVTGTTKLNYTTNPITATAIIEWELYMTPSFTHISFTKSGENNPAMTVPISPAELTAKKKTVSDLDAGTTYIVKLLNNEDVVAQAEIITPNAPSGTMTVCRPEDGDLREIVISPDRKDTVFLIPGTYTFTSTLSTAIISKNIVLIGEDVKSTIVNMQKNIVPQGNFDRMVFKNITFNCDTYFMQAAVSESSKQFNINSLIIENCIFNLGFHTSTNSTILSLQGRVAGFKAKISQCSFNNVTTYSYSSNPQFTYIQVSGSDPYIELGEIKIKNCTSTNTGRGIVTLGQIGEPVKLNIENCTFYKLNQSNNTVIYASKTTNATINIKNSVFHFGSTGFKFIDYTTSSVINIENSYFFKGQTPLFNNSEVSGNMGMSEYPGTSSDLFVSPDVNPVNTGTSFKIKDASMTNKNIGDLRWK